MRHHPLITVTLTPCEFHYAMARPIVTRLVALDFSDEGTIDDLTDHITRFSIAGIESVRHRLRTEENPHADDSHAEGKAL
jgi:TetR/AcrR family transcriptional regulator, regulator of cefoperazone and chloramphenicol sensitivity